MGDSVLAKDTPVELKPVTVILSRADLALFKQQNVTPLKHINPSFPRAMFHCRLCSFHLSRIPEIHQHIKVPINSIFITRPCIHSYCICSSESPKRKWILNECWITIMLIKYGMKGDRHVHLQQMEMTKRTASLIPDPSPTMVETIGHLIENVYRVSCLLQKDLDVRTDAVNSITEFIETNFPGLRVRTYGSFVTGTSENEILNLLLYPIIPRPHTHTNTPGIRLKSRYKIQDDRFDQLNWSECFFFSGLGLQSSNVNLSLVNTETISDSPGLIIISVLNLLQRYPSKWVSIKLGSILKWEWIIRAAMLVISGQHQRRFQLPRTHHSPRRLAVPCAVYYRVEQRQCLQDDSAVARVSAPRPPFRRTHRGLSNLGAHLRAGSTRSGYSSGPRLSAPRSLFYAAASNPSRAPSAQASRKCRGCRSWRRWGHSWRRWCQWWRRWWRRWWRPHCRCSQRYGQYRRHFLK